MSPFHQNLHIGGRASAAERLEGVAHGQCVAREHAPHIVAQPLSPIPNLDPHPPGSYTGTIVEVWNRFSPFHQNLHVGRRAGAAERLECVAHGQRVAREYATHVVAQLPAGKGPVGNLPLLPPQLAVHL